MLRRWPLFVLAFGLMVVLVSCSGRGGVSISVSPGEVTLAPGESVVFTAVVVGGAGAGVEWSSSGGVLVPSGSSAVFTGPDEVGEYTVTARSARDRGRWASASVIVVAEAVDDGPYPPSYTGEAPVVGETDVDGALVIVSEVLGVRYELAFRSEGDGEALGGLWVDYRENGRGRSEFRVVDPSGRFAPLWLVGTAEEIAAHLGVELVEPASMGVHPQVAPVVIIGGVVFLNAMLLKYWDGRVAAMEVREFVETGVDLCGEADVYCTCASLGEVVALQKAQATIDAVGGEMFFSTLLFALGLGVGGAPEVAGVLLDLATWTGAEEDAKELLLARVRAVEAFAGLDEDEPLLVRLLVYAEDDSGMPSWRGVQILDRGCGAAVVPDNGTLDVMVSPSPPSPGENVVIEALVAGPVEAGLTVVLAIGNVGSALEFRRVMVSTTNDFGRAEFVVPPFYSSLQAWYVVSVPERDLVLRGVFEWDWRDGSVGRPMPTIWYFEPTRSRFDAPGGVNFWYQVSQVHEVPEFEKDLTCTLSFGDGSPPRSVPCLGFLGASSRIRSDQHVYAAPGDYVARLTAENRDGSRDVLSVPIRVLGDANRAPEVTSFAVSETSVPVGGSVRFDWAVDPDNDSVSCVLNPGDGSRARVFDPCGSQSVTHEYDRRSEPWGFFATLSAVDQRGAYAPSRAAMVVVGHAVLVGEVTLTPGTVVGSAVEGGSAAAVFELENTGDVAVVVESISSDAAWVSVSPSSLASVGVGEVVEVSVTMNAAGLGAGVYSAVVAVSWEPEGGGPVGSGLVVVEFTVAPVAGDPVVVSVSPESVMLPVNGSQSFTATVTGTADTSVSWSATCGSISGSGNTITYTAPTTAGSCSVTATSVADSSKSATAVVTVTDGGADFEPAPSYISIANVSLGAASGGVRPVNFDISWDESWRGPDRPTWVAAPDNWDAAWVFVKYRVDGGTWQHATLAAGGHVVPAGAVVDVPSDRVGAFIYRSSSGYGMFSANGVGLQWDYVADGVAAGAGVEVRPFGVEMVYVPQGLFSVGSGGSGRGEFRSGGTSNSPFVVSSQSSITLGDGSGQLMWTGSSSLQGSPSGSTNAMFPTGFAAFYLMKYEQTQGQYVAFMNTLTQTQADRWAYGATREEGRNGITGDVIGTFATSTPFVPVHTLNWPGVAAYADWAGLRPMTELEFEKAARGPLAPVPNEFAWGSVSVTRATGLADRDTVVETPTPVGSNANYWVSGNPIRGPVRAGSFAMPADSRLQGGAGYYGALELSGNVSERAITVGNEAGRAFDGSHGDGLLTESGYADVPLWPSASGLGVRGGSWYLESWYMKTSDRSYAASAASLGFNRDYGWRGARSAP